MAPTLRLMVSGERKKKEAMIMMKRTRFWFVLMLALGVACAQVPLNDSEEPGSAIIFPKFERGTVAVDGATTARTELELGVVCPIGATCAGHQPVRIRIQWVCPGLPQNASICPTVDYDVPVSVNGKAVFNTEGTSIPANVVVPPPPCPNGYLIGWVIDTNNRPVKFDGLFGDAVIRTTGAAVASYAAIPIQADPALANYNGSNYGAAAIATSAGPFPARYTLPFDGGAGHYRAVAGATVADVEFNNDTGPTRTDTSLILLTLDVRSSLPNNSTIVNLDFYNERERLLSTSWKFLCWTQVNLTNIDPNLTQQLMSTRKGLLVSGQAMSEAAVGTPGNAQPVTLLGLVQTNEFPERTRRSAPSGAADSSTGIGRSGGLTKIYKMFDNSQPVPTSFVPQSSLF
jgi:hypothetical protein